ncbi:MAG: hypothetical protein WAK67_18565, partial [Xanthobacteraceae bacterium]
SQIKDNWRAKKQKAREVSPAWRGEHKGWERQMSYLRSIAIQRPMLRVTGEVLLVFCCAAPLVFAFSSFVAYGLYSLSH